jgi:hypothetical protein
MNTPKDYSDIRNMEIPMSKNTASELVSASRKDGDPAAPGFVWRFDPISLLWYTERI